MSGQGEQSAADQGSRDAPQAGGRHVVDAAGHGAGSPDDCPVGTGDDLHVHPVAAVLAGEVGAVGAHTVGADERAVQHQVELPVPLCSTQRGLQFRGAGRQQRHRLLHIPPRGGGRDPETGRELRERLAFAQVDQHEQGLAAGVEPPPGRADALAVTADQLGEVFPGWTRQINGGTIEQRRSSWSGRVLIVVINPSTRGFFSFGAEPSTCSHPVIGTPDPRMEKAH